MTAQLRVVMFHTVLLGYEFDMESMVVTVEMKPLEDKKNVRHIRKLSDIRSYKEKKELKLSVFTYAENA